MIDPKIEFSTPLRILHFCDRDEGIPELSSTELLVLQSLADWRGPGCPGLYKASPSHIAAGFLFARSKYEAAIRACFVSLQANGWIFHDPVSELTFIPQALFWRESTMTTSRIEHWLVEFRRLPESHLKNDWLITAIYWVSEYAPEYLFRHFYIIFAEQLEKCPSPYDEIYAEDLLYRITEPESSKAQTRQDREN